MILSSHTWERAPSWISTIVRPLHCIQGHLGARDIAQGGPAGHIAAVQEFLIFQTRFLQQHPHQSQTPEAIELGIK